MIQAHIEGRLIAYFISVTSQNAYRYDEPVALNATMPKAHAFPDWVSVTSSTLAPSISVCLSTSGLPGKVWSLS